MKMWFNKLESEKKINEFQNTFLTMKLDEPNKINLKSNELFENEARNNMVKWLLFLSKTLNFDTQTLFRSVLIFDKFISLSEICKLENGQLTQEKLNLITIACLSLATKLEEVNCNYVSFFTEKVLNLPNCKTFTNKDLTKMELIILKQLNFKTLYTTAYEFMLFYLQIFQYFFNANYLLVHNIKILAENIMKENINANIFLNMTQTEYALACLSQSFMQIGMGNILCEVRNILMIFNINNLLKKDKSLNIDNSDNDNESNNLYRNLEVKFLSLPSF